MKRPLEFYAINTASKQAWGEVLTRQECPFIGKRCVKRRKSNAVQTIGACIVGYQDEPLIICPKRFLEGNQIFLDAIRLLKARNAQYLVVPELSIPGGSVDYFMVAMKGDEVLDYCGLEVQGLDTTGSGGIWAAREDLMRDNLRESYNYGVNWKMSAKTILIQMHHKAATFEALGKKLVLTIQRQFFEYMKQEFQADHFTPSRAADTVHLHLYDCVELNHSLRLNLESRISTSVAGIERMLNLGKGTAISEQEIVAKIRAKLPNAISLETV